MSVQNAIEYANGKREEYLEQLKTFLRIPSISTLSEHKGDIRQAAEWLRDEMRRIGLDADLHETPGHPVVLGTWLGAGADAPTVLVYGHYDVQPVDPVGEWKSDPFEPQVRDGKLYARGSTDDKGQVFVNLKAVEALMQAHSGKLPVNIKLLIEGEEEISSANLEAFIEDNLALLAADVCVISDTQIMALDRPSIVYALRGLTYMEIEVHGPYRDLHSGQWGGAVHNPVQALAEIVAALHNPDGSINVEGFYDRVIHLSDAERTALKEVHSPQQQEDRLRQLTGSPQSWGELQYTVDERTSARPTLELNGIIGGFTGEGAKTVLPARAMAKVSCRLVADQDPEEIYQLVKKQVAKITPPTVTSEVRLLHTGNPALVPIDSKAMSALIAAYESGFGKKPVFEREGGSIPVVATFRQKLGAPVLLAGYGLPDDGAHGPDEKFDLECLYRGINTAIALYDRLGSIPVTELRG